LNKNIEIEKWEGFFHKQLGKVENKVIKGIERERERERRREKGFGEGGGNKQDNKEIEV